MKSALRSNGLRAGRKRLLWVLLSLAAAGSSAQEGRDIPALVDEGLQLIDRRDYAGAMVAWEAIMDREPCLERTLLVGVVRRWLDSYSRVTDQPTREHAVGPRVDQTQPPLGPAENEARARLLLRAGGLLLHHGYWAETKDIAAAVNELDHLSAALRGRSSVLMAWSAFRLGDTEFASSVAEKATARYGEIEFVTTSMARLTRALTEGVPPAQSVWDRVLTDFASGDRVCEILSNLMSDPDFGVRAKSIECLVMALLREGREKEAWEAFAEYYRWDGPTSLAGQAALKVARLFENTCRPEYSERALRLLLEAPAYPREFVGRAMLHIAYSLAGQGRTEAAKAQMEQALREYGDIQRVREVATLDVGFYAGVLGDARTALERTQEALKAGIESPATKAEALCRVAEHQLRASDKPAALAAADRAITYAREQFRKEPERVYASLVRRASGVKARCLEAMQRYAEAEAQWTVYEAMGRWDTARSYLNGEAPWSSEGGATR